MIIKELPQTPVLATSRSYEARANILKAMAHPSRLLLLDALHQGELCVADLTQIVGADQSTVSKHLAVLKNAGMVDVRREGTMNYYRGTCPCLGNFMNCIEVVLKANLQAHQEAI